MLSFFTSKRAVSQWNSQNLWNKSLLNQTIKLLQNLSSRNMSCKKVKFSTLSSSALVGNFDSGREQLWVRCKTFFMCWAKYKSYNLFCSYFQKLCMEHFKMVGMISCMFLNRSWSWCELSSAHENFGIWTESYVWLTSGFTVINLF